MKKVLFVLGELDNADLQWMIDAGEVHDLADGDVLIKAGEPNEHVYIVVDGVVSVRLKARGDEEISKMRQGEMVGEISLLDSRTPVVTLVAIGPVRVFKLSHGALRTKMARDPLFAAHFYRAISLFLANRLNRAQMESTQADPQLSEDVQDVDELSPELMDSLHLSGERFVMFLERLQRA
jgi:CRP/FNR family cyclic AMP-dependent transcriptional regulator